MKRIIIIGYDPEIIEMINNCDGFSIKGFVDLDNKENNVYNLNYLGNDEMFSEKYLLYKDCELVITIDDTSKRKSLFQRYKNFGFSFATIISKKANISKYCKMNEGCIVQDLVNISYNVNLQLNVKVNTAANIMHDVKVESHSTIAPNAVLLGYVKIGEMCFIGSHSTILPRIVIANDTTVGAGSVVTRSLETGTYIGIPARKHEK